MTGEDLRNRVYVGADWNDNHQRWVSALQERLEALARKASEMVTKFDPALGQPRP